MSLIKNKSTINDFHEQWICFQEQYGVYASEDFFWDYFGPLLKKTELKDKDIAEIGCGNGRFVKIFSRYANRAVGYEPSGAIDVARRYCHDDKNINFYQTSVYDITERSTYDVILCLGVLHHLPDPLQALVKMKSMLKPGGICCVWVYGREGNGLYLGIFKPLMYITSRLPHKVLNSISFILALIVKIYSKLVYFSHYLPWPMKNYMLNIVDKLDFYHLKLGVYDQLNPSIANYYTRSQIEELARQAGFIVIGSYHRHGYSWTVKLI